MNLNQAATDSCKEIFGSSHYAFLHEKRPAHHALSSSLGCILTLNREIAGTDERVRAIPGVRDRRV